MFRERVFQGLQKGNVRFLLCTFPSCKGSFIFRGLWHLFLVLFWNVGRHLPLAVHRISMNFQYCFSFQQPHSSIAPQHPRSSNLSGHLHQHGALRISNGHPTNQRRWLLVDPSDKRLERISISSWFLKHEKCRFRHSASSSETQADNRCNI